MALGARGRGQPAPHNSTGLSQETRYTGLPNRSIDFAPGLMEHAPLCLLSGIRNWWPHLLTIALFIRYTSRNRLRERYRERLRDIFPVAFLKRTHREGVLWPRSCRSWIS